MGNLLDTPKTEKESDQYVTSTGLSVGSSGMQGWRLEMEDSHISIDMPSRPDHAFFAVFDGHGGAGAAAYAASNMIKVLEETALWRLYVKGGASDIQILQDALSQAFLDIDSQLRVHQNRDDSKDFSGCTSVTAMITPKYIICANAGDSRCVLGTNNQAKAMSDDHKPNNPLEQNRIELAGGKVQWKRVDGDLAVSRGLGDFQFKARNDLGPSEQKVSCEPEFVIHTRCPEDEVLLLACDGLWDVMENEEAITKIREIFASGGNVMSKVAEDMLNISFQKGSKDNISAVVVQLPGAKIAAPDISGSTPSATSASLRPVDDEEASIDMGSPPDKDL